MKLKRNTPIVRYYAFLLHIAGDHQWQVDAKIERISNLCQFVRALILRTVITALLAGVLALLLTGFAIAVYADPITILGVLIGLPMTAGLILISGVGIRKLISRHPPGPDGVFVAYLKAIKRGICPLLTIERD